MACLVAVNWTYNGERHVKPLIFSRVPAIGEVVDIGDDLYFVDRVVHMPGGDELRSPSSNIKAVVGEPGKTQPEPVYAVIWVSRPDDDDESQQPSKPRGSWAKEIGEVFRIIMGRQPPK